MLSDNLKLGLNLNKSLLIEETEKFLSLPIKTTKKKSKSSSIIIKKSIAKK